MGKLTPVKTMPIKLGETVDYRGVKITLDKKGNLHVNGSKDPRCVMFPRGSGSRFAAVLVNGELKIFEGSQVGPNTLTQERVFDACGL